MATKDETALRDELRTLEEDLARLRQTASELRESIGEGADSPTDAAELSNLTTMAEEQEAIVASLEARRDGLLRRLDG